MFRFFYRYMRREIRRKFSDDYIIGDFAQDVTKWWFEFARNLILASLFAYYAARTGSWLAYVLAHFSFVFFAVFLFHPVLRFILRAAHTSKFKIKRERVTLMSMTWFLFVVSLGMGVSYFAILTFAQFQQR